VKTLATTNEPTVFLLDDDPALRQAVAGLSRSLEMPSEYFGSAEDFLGQFDPTWAGCLVVEARLPGMSGLELLEKLHKEGVFFAAIAVSANADAAMAVRAMKAGAVTFLEKPIPERRLWDSLHEALQCDAEHRRQHARIERIDRRMQKLTQGESDVLALLRAGKSNREIAESFAISIRTVEVRRAKVMEKMKASSLPELLRDVFLLEFFSEKKSEPRGLSPRLEA
jgi:two-component system, LuxR family, response regulator FixJ